MEYNLVSSLQRSCTGFSKMSVNFGNIFTGCSANMDTNSFLSQNLKWP